MSLKDNSGVDEIIGKQQPYQLLNTNREFFPSSYDPTFINWLKNLRKLGQISSPFCIFLSVRRRDKEASNVSGMMSTHLAASFLPTCSDVIENDVISHFLAD